jgi:hypothetical protein
MARAVGEADIVTNNNAHQANSRNLEPARLVEQSEGREPSMQDEANTDRPGGRSYAEFLERKLQLASRDGFEPLWLPSALYPFQRSLVEWALREGRAAIFADCGLGKTLQQLVWAENVVRHTGGRVLILTPLAVTAQTIHEAEKFGVEAHRSRAGELNPGIVVTNYERLHHFDAADFVGCVCDESSILKSFDGERRKAITEFMRKMRYRLLCTATAAPNDYIELGTSSEALGHLGHMDMLNRFFKNDPNNSGVGRHYGQIAKWRFRGHAEEPFWRWVCSWARACRKPSDLGFDDGAFVLPPLHETEHIVKARTLAKGMLFALPATNMREEREERRRTLTERCEKAAELVAGDEPALVWCNLNDEGDLLERLIPGAIQVAGGESDEAKEEKFTAFAAGEARVLVSKPRIGAWGLNFQHCARVTFFASHSFESYYQGVRRCWRFGQKRPVRVDVVATEGEARVLDNLRAKTAAADAMFGRLVEHMNRSLRIERNDEHGMAMEVPAWLQSSMS